MAAESRTSVFAEKWEAVAVAMVFQAVVEIAPPSNTSWSYIWNRMLVADVEDWPSHSILMVSAGAGTGFFILKSMEANDVTETVEGPAVTDTHMLSLVAEAAYSASSKKRRLSVCLEREGEKRASLFAVELPKNT